jgi:hypothetical protein
VGQPKPLMLSLSKHEPSERVASRLIWDSNLQEWPLAGEICMRLRIIASAAIIALATFATTQAKAQDYNVSVTNYQPIPPGTTFVTDMNDNTELTATAESALRKSLAQRGLDYNVNGTIGFKIGTFRDPGGSPNTEASFDSSNTTFNFPFNSGDVKGAPRMGRTYRITLNVYNRASGAVLSHGEVNDNGMNFDPVASTPMMVEALLDKVEF